MRVCLAPQPSPQVIAFERRSGVATLEYVIRPARREDAEGISRAIISALRETNAKDYSEAVIARVEGSFSPKAVLDLLRRRTVFVAVVEDGIVGLQALTVRS